MSTYAARYTLRHKRDHIFLPDPAQPGGAPLSFTTSAAAEAHKSGMHNAHQWRVVRSDPKTGRFV